MATPHNRADRLSGVVERRALALEEFELRKSADGMLQFRGYASLFDKPYEMYGGPKHGGWTERVDASAFDRTLKASPDVVLLINHEGMPLARTSSGTMQLAADKKGLLAEAELDTRDPDVQSLQVKMERRDLSQMSFAFRTNRQEWNNEETERSLLEVDIHRGDVSVVNNGAQPATTSTLRGVADVLAVIRDIDPEEALAEVRSLDDDPMAALLAAQKLVGDLITAMRPPTARTYSVAHAERLLMLDA